MGGACSRKRDHQVVEDSVRSRFSARYSKSGSSRWLGTSVSTRSGVYIQEGRGKCPSLMELCIHKICEVFVFSAYVCTIVFLLSDYSMTCITIFLLLCNRELVIIIASQCSQGI